MDKKEQRKLYRKIRNSISETEQICFSEKIFSQLINSSFYKSAETVLVYVSVGSEVYTLNIIEHSLNNNKKVAVPVCNDNEMMFYEITSSDDLHEGKFGIPTVDVTKSIKVTDFRNCLCIVPALCFDFNGYRIGYGGGYYDRFLSEYRVKTVGLCYERCICDNISIDEFDYPVDYIITENKLRNSGTKGGSTYE